MLKSKASSCSIPFPPYSSVVRAGEFISIQDSIKCHRKGFSLNPICTKRSLLGYCKQKMLELHFLLDLSTGLNRHRSHDCSLFPSKGGLLKRWQNRSGRFISTLSQTCNPLNGSKRHLNIVCALPSCCWFVRKTSRRQKHITEDQWNI